MLWRKTTIIKKLLPPPFITRFFVCAVIFALLCEGIYPAIAQEAVSFDISTTSHINLDSETAAK